MTLIGDKTTGFYTERVTNLNPLYSNCVTDPPIPDHTTYLLISDMQALIPSRRIIIICGMNNDHVTGSLQIRKGGGDRM